jgi:hypothetical protein
MEDCLRSLQGRGLFDVAWSRGLSLICRSRSILLSQAMAAGRERVLFWDDDVTCANPEAIGAFISQPFERPTIAAGLYALKGQPKLAACGIALPMTLGTAGLHPAKYLAAGFMLITREALDQMRERCNDLPECAEEDGGSFFPYFRPLLEAPDFLDKDQRSQYLGEDYSFCKRAHTAGVDVVADSSLLLGHVGSFTWYAQDSLQSKGGRFGPLAGQLELGE